MMEEAKEKKVSKSASEKEASSQKKSATRKSGAEGKKSVASTGARTKVKKAAAKATDVTKGSKEYYDKEVVAKLKEEFKISSLMRVPKLEKIVLNMGLGEAKNNRAVLTDGIKSLELISGQKPIATIAKNSIAGFKIREGMSIGAKVTLRGSRMYDFFQRLIHLTLPRVKDFHGVKRKSFDKEGNFTLGLSDCSIFPELSSPNDPRTGGMSICFVTSTKFGNEAEKLLELMGFPFANKK